MQIEQAMVEGVGIDAGTRDFAEHAHILAGVGSHQHRDQRMQQHSLGDQRRFNGVRGGLLVHAGELDFADQGQRDGACRRDAHRGAKFRRVVLADFEKVAGRRWARAWAGRQRARFELRRGCAGACAAHCSRSAGRSLGLGRLLVSCDLREAGDAGGQARGVGRGRLRAKACADGASARDEQTAASSVRRGLKATRAAARRQPRSRARRKM